MALTEKQNALVILVTSGMTQDQLAEQAGYAHKQAVSRELANPKVRAAIRAAIERQFQTEAAPLALKTLVDVMRDKDAKALVRVAAAKAALAVAGYVAPKARDQGAEEKRPEDMTVSELAEQVERLEREKADRATRVEPVRLAGGAPRSAQRDVKPLSFLD